MKTNLRILTLMTILCSVRATNLAAQTTYTWTGLGDGTNFTDPNNWTPIGLPDGTSQDTAQWDGLTTGDVLVTQGAQGLPGTGFATLGINLNLTSHQTNSVQIISPVSVSSGIGLFNINVFSNAGAFILGDGTANNLRLIARPAGAIHHFVNNSTNPAMIAPSVSWLAGGGNGYTVDFSGTGDWIVHNDLLPDNGAFSPNFIQVDGPGTVLWTKGATGSYQPNSIFGGVSINGGALVIKSSGLFPGAGNQAIINNAIFEFNAPTQFQALSGVISGNGVLKVSDGVLTLSGGSTNTGPIQLNGGELIVNGPENPGLSGPLGVGGTISFNDGTLGFSVKNINDYSARFSTAAAQQYQFDTGGQNVTFATALASNDGTLTKIGSGTLTLTGPSSYAGATTVGGGKLVFQGRKSGSGNITVADGAALGVTGTGTQVTPATLTLGTTSGATLEFNNVTSTSMAPLAAATLSSAGTITVNINSGSFATGQSYPLLTWTSGSAPAVNLGYLNGATGTLSTNGNTIFLNITFTTAIWTGASNGDWDFITTNNWRQIGYPDFYPNTVPVQFDDTATGTTAVTVAAPVQPGSVTVNNTAKNYSIASSGPNNIGGPASLTKIGSGTLTLSGGANTFAGRVIINGGIVSVSGLANGSHASDIGASSSNASSLVLNGGTLRYTGPPVGLDRLFTLGPGGGTIDASGAGELGLTNAGALACSGAFPRVLTLTGTNTGNNTLAATLADYGGAPSSLTKTGHGKWILTGNNTYSGGTTNNNGTLQIGAGGASGSVGAGNIINNGALDFNRSGGLSISSVISGDGSVINNGPGAVFLAGNNTYTGGTTINAGTLQIGTGGNSGALDGNSDITNNATLIFDSSGALTLSGNISGNGQLLKRGSGLLKLLGTLAYNGGTTIDPGAQLQIGQGMSGVFAGAGNITNNGTLIFVRQDNGVFGISNNIVGYGTVVKDVNNPNNGDITFVGTNTYTGGTRIAGGAIILGDGTTAGAGSIMGNVTMTNFSALAGTPTASSLIFNRPDNFTFSGTITGQGSVVQNGSGTVTLTASNTYTGTTTINGGALFINAANTAAATTVNAGTLGGSGTLSGPVTLAIGTTLAPGAPIGSVGRLTISNDLTLGGNVAIDINKSLSPANDFVMVTGTLANNGAGILTVSNLGPSLAAGDKFTLFNKPLQNGGDLSVAGAGATWVNNLAIDGSITVAAVTRPRLNFALGNNSLQLSWDDSFGTFKLQVQTNNSSVGLSTNWIDYPGGGANPIIVPIDPANGTVFFRLVPGP